MSQRRATSSSNSSATSTGQTPPHRRDVNAAERARQALELRKVGASFDAIARACGFSSRSGAYQAIQRELHRTLQEPADDLRKTEVLRLDDLYRAMAPKALKGDHWAVDRCLAIMQRRATLLGLDVSPDEQGAPTVVIRAYPQAWIAEKVAEKAEAQ